MSQLRNQFRPPEGRYVLLSERLNGLINFNPSRFTYLTLAELADGDEAGRYIVFNVQDALHILQYGTTDKVCYHIICSFHSLGHICTVLLFRLVTSSRCVLLAVLSQR